MKLQWHEQVEGIINTLRNLVMAMEMIVFSVSKCKATNVSRDGGRRLAAIPFSFL